MQKNYEKPQIEVVSVFSQQAIANDVLVDPNQGMIPVIPLS